MRHNVFTTKIETLIKLNFNTLLSQYGNYICRKLLDIMVICIFKMNLTIWNIHVQVETVFIIQPLSLVLGVRLQQLHEELIVLPDRPAPRGVLQAGGRRAGGIAYSLPAGQLLHLRGHEPPLADGRLCVWDAEICHYPLGSKQRFVRAHHHSLPDNVYGWGFSR